MEFTKYTRWDPAVGPVTETVAGGLPAGIVLDPRAYRPVTFQSPVTLASSVGGDHYYMIDRDGKTEVFRGPINGLMASSYYLRHVSDVEAKRIKLARLLADLVRGEQVMDDAGDWSSVRDQAAIEAVEQHLASVVDELAAAKMVAA